MKNEQKYISLKEAAEISGYAPDYIGQLIRKGKLPGKQVYCTVAWMTTEEAIRNHIQKNQDKKENQSFTGELIEKIRGVKTALVAEMRLARIFKMVLYAAIIFSLGFSLLLFYIFSVTVDKKIQQRAIEKIKNNPPIDTNINTKSHQSEQ